MTRHAGPSAHLAACFVAALAAALLTASLQAQTAGSDSAAPSSSAVAPASSTYSAPGESMLFPGDDFQLQAGDLISVQVFLQPDYQSVARIGLDGTIQLPFIGSVPIEGLTVRAAQALIADRLRAGQFYRDPDVIIRVLDTVNGSVIITGEVHATIPVATQRSLKDVLLTAGGLPANASHTVKIVRKNPDGTDQVIVVDLGTDLASSAAANIAIHPHDIIQVTRASVVYVLGAFSHQGAVPLDQASPLTLLQLAALSGGVGFEGRFNDLRLIRTVGNERKVVVVDIKKIREGKDPDPILQANDIVFLPTNSMKAALKSAGTNGLISIVSLLIAARSF
jgi:polysaccharide export outer membrane protein